MCFFKPKVPKVPDIPKKEDTTGDQDILSQIEAEKRRRGFKSTFATSGQGVMEPANIRKQKTGE